MSRDQKESIPDHISDYCFENIKESTFVKKIADTLPCIVLVINDDKEVIYFNQNLPNLLEAENPNIDLSDDLKIIGKKLGDIFHCINAKRTGKGCGFSDFCGECGIAKSVSQSYTGSADAFFECRISTTENESFDFQVLSTVYDFNDKRFTFVSLEDISEHKRKEVLEHTFFHDINNLLHIINAYSELLSSDLDHPSKERFLTSIKTAAQRMKDEIDTHKRIIQAENGSLAVNMTEVNSIEILAELTTLFTKSKTWADKHILIDDNVMIVDFKTDKAILLRILNNMTKNALEASSDCGDVKVNCYVKDESIIFNVHNCGYIPYPAQGQIFQRSFSTKGKGRGIGTYSMKLFGEKYLNGKVWFESSMQNGTSFNISIPLY